ncbi:MAG: hypothetical protein H9W81_08360 [Enterococcus sp.]|nr:hypothetical protein [Enterococcus sp.]
MLITKQKIAQPENPPARWGVEPRAAKLWDYKWVALFGTLFLVPLAIAAVPGWFGIDIPSGDRAGWGFIAAMLCFVFLGSMGDPGGRYAEANAIADKRSEKWQREVLIPFLEEKYAITIPGNPFNTWGWCRAQKGKKTIEFHYHGIHFERDSFKPDSDGVSDYFCNVKLDDDVWIEEVISPDRVKFRAIPEF